MAVGSHTQRVIPDTVGGALLTQHPESQEQSADVFSSGWGVQGPAGEMKFRSFVVGSDTYSGRVSFCKMIWTFDKKAAG